jgi:hypothetical protein
MKKSLHLIALALVAIWFGWTVLVDIFLVPQIFKIVDQFWVAGRLGLTFFTKLNQLEMITGSALVGLLAISCRRNKIALMGFVLSVLLFSIALTYFAYLIPKMAELTDLWQKAEGLGIVKIGGYEDVQQEHQYFHRVYVTMDVVKLIILTSCLGLLIWMEEKWR